jgi:hypothetical protein
VCLLTAVLGAQSDSEPYHLVPCEEETPHNQHLQTEIVDDLLLTKKYTEHVSLTDFKLKHNMLFKKVNSIEIVCYYFYLDDIFLCQQLNPSNYTTWLAGKIHSITYILHTHNIENSKPWKHTLHLNVTFHPLVKKHSVTF